MRTTIVPAQITTVEDKIAGNLTVAQMLLLLAPIFLGGFIYIVLPPQNEFTSIKLITVALMVILAGTLAIRVKGRVVFQWLAILLTYTNRPRYFVCDKNDVYERDIISEQKVHDNVTAPAKVINPATKAKSLSLTQIHRLERLVKDPNAKVRFLFAKKGGMRVSFAKVH